MNTIDWTILIILWLHFVGDFVAQTDKMAINKSKSNLWLTFHLAVYSSFLFLIGWQFALINFALHWGTDYFSSRATSKLWAQNKRHEFFVVIGLDQAIHMTCLFMSYWLLNGGV